MENLPEAARSLRNLLREVDAASKPLWRGRALDGAIHRYVEIFLPMLAAHRGLPSVSELREAANAQLRQTYDDARNDEDFKHLKRAERAQYLAPFDALEEAGNVTAVAPVPPLDVAFCWVLHRLSPAAYAADCVALFGAELPATNGLDYVGTRNADDARAVVARLQWTCFSRAVRNREPRRLFRHKACRPERKTFLPRHLWPRFVHRGYAKEIPFIEENVFRRAARWESPLRYDLVAAAARQKQFLFNVSAPYFDADAALARGCARYARFLALMRDYPGAFLVPLYDIDLAWHAHILRDTAAYAEYTRRVVGRFVDHIEDGDRSEDGQLANGFRRTAALWQQAYDEAYEDSNTSYKGRIGDSRKRVMDRQRSIFVHHQPAFRNRFVREAVCDDCKHKAAWRMELRCQLAFMRKTRLARGGQVKGGACAALYNRGFIGSVALYSAPGGSCGGTYGDAFGGYGCGGGVAGGAEYSSFEEQSPKLGAGAICGSGGFAGSSGVGLYVIG